VALFLEPPFALAVGMFMLAEDRRDRMLGLGWLAFLTPALMLTLSRGAYLAIAVLAVIVVVGNRRRIPLIAGLAVLVVVLWQIPLVNRRFAGQFDLTNPMTTIRGRLTIFTDTVTSDVSQHPIFGVGLGGYHYLFHGRYPEIYPHDLWLTFWVEIGLLGVIAFAIIFIGLAYRGWMAYRVARGFAQPLLWGVLGTLVLWGVHGLVDSPYWKNDMSIEFWIVAALELAAIRWIAEAKTNAASPQFVDSRPA
jgi:O-antigen ligase